MKAHFIRDIPRPPADIVEKLRKHGSATVHEALGRIGAMHSSVKPLAKGMRICGPAFTVRSPAGDNVTILKAIKEAKKGDVIVVNNGRVLDSGPFGELTAIECRTKGLGGFITMGSVRDSAEIIAMGFPVFSAGLSIFGTVKESIGVINHPIAAGDVIVNPGDIVIGDDDGVMVVPLERAAEAAELSDARQAKEAAVMERLRAGESIFDIYGYRKVLERNGWIEE